MKSIRRFFLNLSLRTKFLLIVFAALLSVFTVTMVLVRLPYQAYDHQLYESSVQTISLFAEKLETQMDEIAELSYRILSDNGIQKYLPALYKSRTGSEEWTAAHSEISKIVSSYAHSTQDILSLGLYGENNVNFFYAFGSDKITTEQRAELKQIALNSDGREQWVLLPGETLRPVLVRNVRETHLLTLRSLSVEIIVPDFTKLVDRCRKSMEALGFPLALAIYAGDACLYASDDRILEIGPGENGYSFVDLDGTQALCVRNTSNLGWNFVTVLPYDEILADVRATTKQSVIISLAVFLVTVLICVAMISSIMRQMKVLVGKFDAFARGEIPSVEDSEPYLKRKDEIGQLYLRFDEVARSYDSMMRDNYNKQLLLQQAQLGQLRTQIRPHFLYNTLESIYCLAQFSGDSRIATMTDALGKMLRKTLSDKRDVVTVAEDWQLAAEYLRIQLLRYEDRLRVSYEVEEQYQQVMIPSMSLQPIVENAVHYAAEEMTEQCVIRVFGRTCPEGVEIVVEDNGPGMDEDILQKLERGEIEPAGMGIGLGNIQRRIQLSFSAVYGLRISRRDGRTQVALCVPDRREQEEEYGEVAAG